MRVIFLCEWVPVPQGAGFLISSGNNYFPLRRKFLYKYVCPLNREILNAKTPGLTRGFLC